MPDWVGADVLVPWLQRLLACPSEQTDLQERDPAVVDFIKRAVAPLLYELDLAPRFDPMGNLVLELGPRGAERSLMFCTYAMTHPAANMREPFAASLIDTPHGAAVRGRGASEQKAALAAALGALAQAARGKRLTGRLIFTVLTAGETGRHDAVTSVAARLERMPQFAVVCIGTDSKVAIGNKGRVDFDVTVHGKAAHSSVPSQGINAINGAWRLLEKIEAVKLPARPHPAFGPATLTATALSSTPKATHTIQDRVRITCDRRLLPGEDPEQAFASIAEQVSIEPPWRLEWTRGPIMFPNEIATDGPLYRHLTDAYARAGLGTPTPFHCNFALDAGFFARHGVEAVMLGPGAVDQFHSDEEYVAIADVTRMAAVYHRLIESCLT